MQEHAVKPTASKRELQHDSGASDARFYCENEQHLGKRRCSCALPQCIAGSYFTAVDEHNAIEAQSRGSSDALRLPLTSTVFLLVHHVHTVKLSMFAIRHCPSRRTAPKSDRGGGSSLKRLKHRHRMEKQWAEDALAKAQRQRDEATLQLLAPSDSDSRSYSDSSSSDDSASAEDD
jgi:hypothetical protein